MAFKKNLAQKIIEASEHQEDFILDLHSPGVDEKDFRDTAEQLISTGQINAKLTDNEFTNLSIEFRR